MEITGDLFELLVQLVPGFIAAGVLYALTPHPRPSQFERVIQALIFSVLIKGVVPFERDVFLFLGKYISLGAWDPEAAFWNSVLIAIGFGVVCSYLANNDKLYALLR